MSNTIVYTFTGTGLSPIGASDGGRTLDILGTDAFTVVAEASRDAGATWNEIESFTASVIKNFEWSGEAARIRFNCTQFTSQPVKVDFQ